MARGMWDFWKTKDFTINLVLNYQNAEIKHRGARTIKIGQSGYRIKPGAGPEPEIPILSFIALAAIPVSNNRIRYFSQLSTPQYSLQYNLNLPNFLRNPLIEY